MGGWRRYLELEARAKTGLTSGLFVWALLAVVFGIVTAGFVLLIAFIWLAERYDPLTAAMALAGLLATIIAAVCCLWSRRRTIEQAELALAARRNVTWLDPKVLGSAIQVEPCPRLAQARSAVGRRDARRRRWHGMVCARPSGGRERGAARPSQACSSGVRTFP